MMSSSEYCKRAFKTMKLNKAKTQHEKLKTHLLSFPFHCLKRSVSVTLGSSENHSSLERGGLMYGRSGSSVTINTWSIKKMFQKTLTKALSHDRSSARGKKNTDSPWHQDLWLE